MCYSKEVSLLAGTVIASGSTYSWFKYYLGNLKAKIKTELCPFYRDIILGISCIGMHQLFEYIAIASQNVIIYKMGLIWSITCMYFAIRAIEHLTHLKFGSRMFAIIIAIIGVDIFMKEMHFENALFWVRGHSHIIWSSAWMFLFIYWNICILYLRNISTSAINKKLLLIGSFCIINISFFISAMYAYSAAFVQRSDAAYAFFSTIGIANVMNSFNVVTDSPSIWCVFAATQAVTIPIFFYYMNKYYDVKAPLRIRSLSLASECKFVATDIVIWLILFFTLPIFPGVALKMLFK